MKKATTSWESAHAEGRRWKAADAEAAVEAYRQSGQTLGEFSQRHGIKPERLRWWEKRLSSRGEACMPDASTTLRAVDLAPVAVRSVIVDGVASVSVQGGIRVDVQDPEAVPPEWIAEVIVALQGEGGRP